MSRKISREAAEALANGTVFKRSNTEVVGRELFLHGNKIAWLPPRGDKLYLCMCGWGSVTTRERLNAVMDEFYLNNKFSQRDGEQYYGDTAIDPWRTIVVLL